MRSLPARIMRRNRNNAEADRNAQFYSTQRPPCARCGHSADDHAFGGPCDQKGCACQGRVDPQEQAA